MVDLAPMISYDEQLKRFLLEDVGSGDVTTRSVFSGESRRRKVTATIFAESDGVFCGGPFGARILSFSDPAATFDAIPDGQSYRAGERLVVMEGALESILLCERVILNLLKHLSGISSLTFLFVEKARLGRNSDRPLRITGTRKTLPGLRDFQRYAIRAGGGDDHRMRLDDGILIKDNHIAASASLPELIARVRRQAPHPLRIEMEADTPEQAREACRLKVDILLLDNMSPDLMKQLIPELRSIHPGVLLEVSGGITLDHIPALSTLDVDILSVGALTHSAPDASMRLDLLS
ncbi:carboxylating nicotinate-nucleotide diphosphorylase [Leptospirillum ferrooxidans]|jgi:nicotinate-nucleotide pyrophosphorylase (carboxylating)|uniref:nicotinate-nucleotide diphosphorylase (carboxylating) n=1 Tax=Leptospirillum ferrooxidans (strain C2-3) TaxID=1162668 RepID=I0IPI6_LEPFC|nr:carboxylating nicotinate-nucleotide diphosphorylase [Leptospirillum ferrooxidans]BAM07185.1 putative nicotinate-nucleotide pyrophosphorylase [Leptospirillum ferrooxidans C2-3]